MKNRLRRVVPWLELLVALGVGLVLYLPLDRKDLAEIAWVTAAIVGVARIAYLADMRHELEPVHDLVVAMGLRSGSDTRLYELTQLHDRISAPELQLLRDDVLSRASASLQPLADDLTSEPLEPSLYYEWLNRMLSHAKQGTRIRAVTTMLESEWDESPPEQHFLKANIDAAKRGVQVERLFIVPEQRLSRFGSTDVARVHALRGSKRLIGSFITRETLAAVDDELLSRLGAGFIAFGSSAALIDLTVPPDPARGQVTMSVRRLTSLLRAFDQAGLHSTPLTTLVNDG